MSVLPFLQILFDPKLFNTDKKIFFVWEFIGSPSYSQFISILAFVISFILLLSSSANLYIQLLRIDLQENVKKGSVIFYLGQFYLEIMNGM